MRKTQAVIILALMLTMPLSARNRRVAVIDFDFGAVHNWWGSHWDIGKGIAEMLVTELVRSGTYDVIERRAVETVLAEQNFSNSERANPATAAAIGQILGVDAVIFGSVTQFGTENREINLDALAGRWRGDGRGQIGASRGKAQVAVDARLIDVSTAQVAAVARGLGDSSRHGLLLGAFASGRDGYAGGSIDMNSTDFRQTILGEATVKAVEGLSRGLLRGSDRIAARDSRILGLIAYIDGSQVILNLGTAHGIQVGDHLTVLKRKATVLDPVTGTYLREITEVIGEVVVTDTDSVSAGAAVRSGSGFQVGDRVQK